MPDLRRMWINQPSTLQPHHKLHGANVLAQPEQDGFARVWFTSGPTISMEISVLALSEGWRQPAPGVVVSVGIVRYV